MTNRESFDWIMGRNTLEELLRYDPKRILEVWTTPTILKEKRKEQVLERLKKEKIPVQVGSKEKLSQMVFSESHQGFIAKVQKRTYLDLQTLLEKQKERSFFLALDTIYDPQNFGALLRVAECFSVDGVIFSKNRGSDITPVVTKASSGASELLCLARVSNLAESLAFLQKEGYKIIVADIGHECSLLPEYHFPDKCVLVMGSEGEGIQPLIKKRADGCVKIPLIGKISSLNVAQSSAILLYHWRFLR